MYYRCADKNSAIEVERDGTICLHVGNKRSFQKDDLLFWDKGKLDINSSTDNCEEECHYPRPQQFMKS
jgi:hypothetical protein